MISYRPELNSLDCDADETAVFMLDVGGEGRYRQAWNLNPSPIVTMGRQRGQPIPRLLLGRAEAIPLPDSSVELIIAERTPLRLRSLSEIQRIISDEGTVILRHAIPHGMDPHEAACQVLSGHVRQRTIMAARQTLQETVFHNAND